MTSSLPFRFDSEQHTYTELRTGAELQHITGMLTRTGWVDRLWMTEESSERGRAIHKLTADYDLGALDPQTCVCGPYRPYLLAHVAAMRVLQLEILAVEEAIVHPRLRFGGRPDRAVRDAGEVGPFEIKSGEAARSHPIQTALQAILLEPVLMVPAEFQKRQCLYLKANGRYKLEHHREASDVMTAREIVYRCTGRL